LDLKGSKWWEAGKDCIMRSFIICMLIDKEGGLAAHVASMGEMGNAYKILVRNLKERDHLKTKA
jgi:hypothetical protein